MTLPTMVVVGGQDYGWNPAVNASPERLRLPYDQLGSQTKYLVEIDGAQHHAFTDSIPFYPVGPRDPRHHRWFAAVTTAFFAAELLGTADAARWLQTEALEALTDGACQQESSRTPPLPGTSSASAAARFEAAAVLVATADEILFEDYHNGANVNTATHIQSATKAFWAAAAAAALQDGLLESFDERVALSIREWLDPQHHRGKSLIEVRHLLSLSSGLCHDVDQIQGHDAGASDIYTYVVDKLALNGLPGARFQYGPSHYYAFGVLLERKLASAGRPIDPLEYLDQRILQPMGLRYDNWVRDPSGNPHIPNGCFITPREWITYGQFLLAEGRWNGQQVIEPEILREILVADGPNPGHGRFLWLNRPGGFPAESASRLRRRFHLPRRIP